MAPLSHIMGIANLMVTLWAGATLALMGRLDLKELVDALASGERTHLSAVPTVYARLCEYITANHIDLSRHRVRYLSAGGAPLDAGVKARVEELFGVRLVNGYGMTECAPGCRSRADVDTPAESIGWPEEGVEARIVKQDATPAATEAADVAAEETGELWLRSPSSMLGYYRDPAATAAALRPGGWLATGDLARWRPDGSIALVGRCKEMIIRAGFNVYPAEVEAAINRQPGVLQSGVVGRKRADGDEEVVAFVQPRVDASLEVATLRAGLRAQLAPYKVPAQIVVVEQLPLGSSGKIHKAVLMEQAVCLPS
jgi:acyl-CoA synthetase (AMP-forming)/AMP-acid ligase II